LVFVMTLFVMTRARAVSIATVIWLLPAAGQGPVFQAETRIVEVAIVARDSKDEAVTDLTADDLRIFDNGAEQKILSFDKLWDPPHAADGLPIGLPPKRRTVVLIDNLHASGAAQIYARQGFFNMLKVFPQGSDRISIYTLGDELKVLKDFTPYTMGLRMAVGEYSGEEPTIPPANRFLWTLQALRTIAADLKKIPGEKNLVWLMSGFRIESYEDVARTMRELAAAQVVLYPVDVSGLKLLPPPRGMGPVPWQKAGRGGGAGRGPVSPVQAESEGMYELAELTGGRVYDDSNDLAGLIRAAIEDSREGYALTYAPNNYQKDGSKHAVKVRTERKGLELRYRPGYFADSSVK
jgi:VWFA-related protein